MILIVVFYLILGCFMETISMMILTTPFIAPIVFALGWDPIWWGIVLTILIEAALITPPVGLNLYVVQGMRGRGSINEVIRGALPFVFAMVALIGAADGVPRYCAVAAALRHGGLVRQPRRPHNLRRQMPALAGTKCRLNRPRPARLRRRWHRFPA